MKPCSSLIAVLPLLCAMASCTEVDLCQAEHPHRSFMDFRFHWKEEYQGNRPDSMGVIAVRPVNILRYEFRITAEESHNNGILMQPETERQPSADTLAPAGTHNLWVRSGEYNFATFGWDEGELVDAIDIVDAQGDAATLGSGLYLTYRHYPVDDPKVTGAYGEWKDYNAYSDFISSEGVPVFYARVDHVSVPLAKEGTGQVVVDFTPEPLTQDVSFVFHIEKTADVVVDRPTNCCSGRHTPPCLLRPTAPRRKRCAVKPPSTFPVSYGAIPKTWSRGRASCKSPFTPTTTTKRKERKGKQPKCSMQASTSTIP